MAIFGILDILYHRRSSLNSMPLASSYVSHCVCSLSFQTGVMGGD